MKRSLETLVKSVVSQEFGQEIAENTPFVVTLPPKPEMGDYATNAALVLAKHLGKNPKEVAEQLVESFKVHNVESIESISVMGGFINFKLHAEQWFKGVIEGRESKVESRKSEKIMVEYLSPNTNKPLHLGHLRNGVTGSAVIRLLRAQGHEVVAAGIINDRGVHICKAMLAYQRWGNGATPESVNKKPDAFVGDYYVQFAQEAANKQALEQEAQDMLRKWEAGDAEVVALWKQIREWVLQGWKPTEELLGFGYDKVYFESDVYLQGKEIVEQGLAKGVFRKNESGNVVFDLDPAEFGTNEDGTSRLITMLRADGTSLYTTQDLGLAVNRATEFSLDRLVYVVGSEQRFHFQSLFAILKALGYEWAQHLYHLWYGMVYLPDGKMKSREGTVVDADNLISDMVNLARQEIESRLGDKKGVDEISNSQFLISKQISNSKSQISNAELEMQYRSRVIALAAIKFYLLKQKATTDIHFDPKESIAFEGFTGPYCLYTYARAKSILRQSSAVIPSEASTESRDPSTSVGMIQEVVDYSVLGTIEERQLLQYVELLPEVIQKSADLYDPSLLATHVFKTAQLFNQFYSASPVLKADETVRIARLQLVQKTAETIAHGLQLLGIETLEEM